MADQELRIKAIIDEVDDSKLQKSLATTQTNSAKSLAGNANNPQTLIDQQIVQAGKLQDRMKLLGEVQSRLASQPGAERSLAKVNQELAGVYSRYKNIASDSGTYLSNLVKEVELRKQAAQYTKIATQNEGTYSAHSDRQFAMLQQISGQVPGGGILNRFIGGFKASSGGGGVGGIANAAEGAEGVGGFGGALAGGAATAAFAAVGVAVSAMVSKLNDFVSTANQLAQSASSATSSLGQLRTQLEKQSISQNIGASSPGVTGAANAKSWIGQQWDNFVTNAFNSPQMIKQGINESISQGLGGDDKEQWRRIKEAGQDAQIDLARQKQGIDIQQSRQNRDLALQEKSYNIDVANQRFDLQKTAQRQEQDYQFQKALFDQNHAGEMAAKEFSLQQKYAKQGFELQKQYDQQNFQISQSYKAQDFQISQQRAQTQYSISASDKSYDFGVSQSRNAKEFGINRQRQGEDYQESLQRMALSGNASGLDYLFASRDFQKQQRRELEDYQRQKQYSQADFSLSQNRDLRNYNLSKTYAAQDYNIGVTRDNQQFQIGQNRNQQQFNMSQQQAQEQRNLQIEDMDYQRKIESYQLELQHNRNLEDSTIAFQRLNQAVNLQTERFGNQKNDLKIDQSIQNRDFAIDVYRTLRGQSYNEQDFAGAERAKNPLGAYGQTLIDPTFAAASTRYSQATGMQPLADQVNASIDDTLNGPGSILARLFNNPLSLFGSGADDQLKGFNTASPIVPGLMPPGMMGNSNGSVGAPTQVNFNPQINPTFPTVGGVSQQQYQQMMQELDKYKQAVSILSSNTADAINRIAGGTGPGFSTFLG